MLLATDLERVFLFEEKGIEIRLTDPNPEWSAQAVLNFYSNNYPVLTTAKVSTPAINGDVLLYRFQSVMGTKG